jgi:protein SCO1
MNAKTTIIGFCLFAGLIIAAALVVIHHRPAATSTQAEQTFHVNGVVRSVETDGQTVLIEHEDIPGFMPSMTMPFTVKDPALVRGLKSGDRVRFTLLVTKDDSWITQLECRGESSHPSAVLSSSTSTNRVAAEVPELQPGQAVPNFTLTDQNGQACRLQDYRGQAVLLTFVYTRCPLPNFCPLMSKNFADLQERLAKEFAGRFHLLTVSFDPEHDTPEVLKHYAEAFTQDERTWTFATGTASEIQRVASEFGLIYLPESGTFTHDLRTALIAPDGRLVHIWRSNVWTPYEVQRRVGEVLGSQPGSAALASSNPGSSPQLRD